MTFVVERRDLDDVVVLIPKGSLVMFASKELVGKVDLAIIDGKRLFVIDMAAVAKVDSVGFGDLVLMYTRVTREGGRLVYANVNRKIYGDLEVMKLEPVFREITAPSVDEALKLLKT